MMIIPRKRSCVVSAGLGIAVIGWCIGCEEPLRRGVPFDPPPSEIKLDSKQDRSHYDWPLLRDVYRVARPAPLAFINAIDQPTPIPDPLAAELVAWSDEGLGDEMQAFLRRAFRSFHTRKPANVEPLSQWFGTSDRLHQGNNWDKGSTLAFASEFGESQNRESRAEMLLEIAPNEFQGKQAFDLSRDGSRLVVLQRQGWSLFDALNGSLLKHHSYPQDGSVASDAFDAVRFCGTSSEDLLLASPEMIYRIRQIDGAVTASTRGCGEAIAQWIIKPDGSSMILRTQSGRLFGGDTNFQHWAAYQLPGDPRLDAVALSVDGLRIGAWVDSIPQSYVQRDNQIVDHQIHEGCSLHAGGGDIAMVGELAVWSDGDNMFLRSGLADDSHRLNKLPMFWRPVRMEACYYEPGSYWLLIAGYRLIDDQEQPILFEFDPTDRRNSLPMPLRAMPDRLVPSACGSCVALADHEGLVLIRRDVWLSQDPRQLKDEIGQFVRRGELDQLETALQMIAKQTRLAHGRYPEELRTLMMQAIADHWMNILEQEPASDLAKQLQQWRELGGVIATTVSSQRSYRQAWNAREKGIDTAFNQDDWKEYIHHLQAARQDISLALQHPQPPALALSLAINIELELKEDLGQVEPWARQAFELYPSSLIPAQDLTLKLTPQWFGVPGEALSFALSYSRLLQGSAGDLHYARLVSNVSRHLSPSDSFGWQPYHPRRAKRGLDEWFRIGLYPDENLWRLLWRFRYRDDNGEYTARILRYLIENTAAPPERTSSYRPSRYYLITKQIEQWRAEAVKP